MGLLTSGHAYQNKFDLSSSVFSNLHEHCSRRKYVDNLMPDLLAIRRVIFLLLFFKSSHFKHHEKRAENFETLNFFVKRSEKNEVKELNNCVVRVNESQKAVIYGFLCLSAIFDRRFLTRA